MQTLQLKNVRQLNETLHVTNRIEFATPLPQKDPTKTGQRI